MEPSAGLLHIVAKVFLLLSWQLPTEPYMCPEYQCVRGGARMTGCCLVVGGGGRVSSVVSPLQHHPGLLTITPGKKSKR